MLKNFGTIPLSGLTFDSLQNISVFPGFGKMLFLNFRLWLVNPRWSTSNTLLIEQGLLFEENISKH